MSSKNIKVAIKARPILKKEKDNKLISQWKVVNNSLRQIDSQTEPFYFDHVFDQDASNQDVFDTVVKPIVDAAVEGFNGTIFAYGQTSSGKTYTMLGDENNPGVMVLTAKEIFKEIELAVNRQFLLRVGYIEIYNEKVFDLLNKANVDLKVHETPNGDITVNCEEFIVTSEESLMKYLQAGSKHRRMGETNMNERSSRSHSIFRIIIESSSIDKPPEEGSVQISNLNLVDLAGSERADQTGATGTRLKEGAHINKSLLYLSRVINSLSENEPLKYINYRDSKLTRILQASLGGNALTAIVCNINPTAVEETNSTLNFAMRAKSIKNKPQVNEVLSDTASIKRLQREIARLESELQSTNNKMKVIQLERQICEERLKIVHSHSRSKDTNLRRRTWSACVHPKPVEELQDLKPSVITEQPSHLKPSVLPLKMMTPLITIRGQTLSPLKEFKSTHDDLNEISILNDPNEFLKTPEVFRHRDRKSEESPADNSIRCRQMERELEELMDFTNLERRYNVEHEVFASLNRKLQEAQDKVVKYEEEKFEILSSKLDEWKEKEEALRQQYFTLENEMTEKNKFLEALKNKEADYKAQLDQSKEKIKTLQMELSDKSGKEYELELHQQRAKNRECELLEALKEKEKEIKNLNEKLKFVNDIQNTQGVRRSTLIKLEQPELKNICEKCNEYKISFNTIKIENLKLRDEKFCIQKESDELSSQLMETIQECDSLRAENEKLKTELSIFKEQSITSIEESKLKSRKDNILRFYQELAVNFPEFADGSAAVNNCLSIFDLCDFWEETLRKCTKKLNQLHDNIMHYESTQIERRSPVLLDDLLILKEENKDLLEKIKNLEKKNLNLHYLFETKEQEIMKLTEEHYKLDLLVKDSSELHGNANDLENKLSLKNDIIAKLKNEMSAMKQEWLQKLNNLEPLKTQNEILYAELSESTCTISQQLNEIKNLTTQIEILEQQVNKEKALSSINMLPVGVSTVLLNENTFVEKETSRTEICKHFKMETLNEFIINLDAFKLVVEENTSSLSKEGNFEERYAKLVVKDVVEDDGSLIYRCGLNQGITNTEGDNYVVLLKGYNKNNIKLEIKYISKLKEADEVVKKETSDDKNLESFNVKDDILIKNIYSNNEIMRDSSKAFEVNLATLDSQIFTTCSFLNEKIQWLDEKLSLLEKSQRMAQKNTYKKKSQVTHDVLSEEHINLIQQIKNVGSRILEKMLELNCIIEAFNVKLQNIEKLRDALKHYFFKMKQQSETLIEKRNTIEKANDDLNSEMCSLKKLISDTQVQLDYLQIENSELKNYLIQEGVKISDLRKENDKCSNEASHLKSAIMLQKNTEEENLKKLLALQDIVAKQIINLESAFPLERNFGEENLNRCQQSKIPNKDAVLCSNELKRDVKKMNNLLSSISFCIKGQFELREHNNSKNDNDSTKDNDIQGKAEDSLSLIVLNEKLENLLKEIQYLDLINKKDKAQLKEASNLLSLENSSLKSKIFEIQKYNEELQQKLFNLNNTLAQKSLENDVINEELKSNREINEKRNEELQEKLLDLNNIKTLLENKLQQYEKTLAQLSHEKNLVNDELKSSREINESLAEEVKGLKDLKNELERQRDIYCEENSKLEIELRKSNDLIEHTEEDCMTLKLSVSSLRDKVLQLEKERNTLLTERIKYEANIEELSKNIINLQEENNLLISKLDNLNKEHIILMQRQEENTKLCDTIEELEKEILGLKSQKILISSKFDNLNMEHNCFLEKHKEQTNLCRSLEESIILLKKELEACNSKKNYLEMQSKDLELQNQQLSLNMERLNARVQDLCDENQKVLKDCNEECERLRKVLNTTNNSHDINYNQLQETKTALEIYEKRLLEECSLQVQLQKKVDELSKKLEDIKSDYNACLLQIKQYSTSDTVEMNYEVNMRDNSLLKQLHELQKMHLFKCKELQNHIKTLETAHSELLQSISKTQISTSKHCFSVSGNKGESNKPAIFASDLRHLNYSNDQRHQKIIDNLLGENKQLRIKNEKLEAELTSTRILSQKDRKSRRQSTHDEKRQSLWDSTCEVGTMTQPTDQLCNCEEFDLKVKELKRQLKIKECQINTLLLEMKTSPLKEENQSLKELLAEEESEKKKLRIDILKLKQEVLEEANKRNKCSVCSSKADKIKLNKNIQTENLQSERDEELYKLQKKYEDLKAICRMRKDAIRKLEEKINTEKENEANNKQNPIEKCVPLSYFQNSQEMLETLKEENRLLKKKYEQSKVICISRGEEIQCLEAKLKKS